MVAAVAVAVSCDLADVHVEFSTHLDIELGGRGGFGGDRGGRGGKL